MIWWRLTMFLRNNIHPKSQLFNENTFYAVFTKDLKRAKQRIIIESPFITAKRFAVIYPLLQKATKHRVRVIINTRDPVEHEMFMQNQALECVSLSHDIGAEVLYTSGLHRKIAIIDNTTWEGSLNVLSQSNSCEIMRRTESPKYARRLIKFCKMSKWYN